MLNNNKKIKLTRGELKFMELLESGMSRQEISVKYFYTIRTIRRYLGQVHQKFCDFLGIQDKQRLDGYQLMSWFFKYKKHIVVSDGKKVTEEVKKEIINLYDQGYRTKEVARQLNLSTFSVVITIREYTKDLNNLKSLNIHSEIELKFLNSNTIREIQYLLKLKEKKYFRGHTNGQLFPNLIKGYVEFKRENNLPVNTKICKATVEKLLNS